MPKSAALLVLALTIVLPSAAQDVAAPSAQARTAFGPAFAAQVAQLAGSFALERPADLASSLSSLGAAFSKSPTAARKLVLVMAAQDPAAAAAKLRATDLPAGVSARLVKIARAVSRRQGRDPALDAAVARARRAQLTPLGASTRNAAKLDALLRQAGEAWRKRPRRPQRPAPAPNEGSSSPSGPSQQRPTVDYGHVSLPSIAMPTLGDNIASLWTQAHEVGPAIRQSQYNFVDMDIAQSIVEKSRQGFKQVIVGDYSNWFPNRMEQGDHGDRYKQRTQAMQYVLDNMNSNIELYILKGLTDIGINHNKFTLFSGDSGELLQGGSFNYSKASQNNHWENVVFNRDADRLAYFNAYHAWLVRRARPFSEDLQPEDPVLDPSDPIPQPPSSSDVVFHGVRFPKVSFSPDGGTEGWLVKAESLVQQTLDILMFAPYPTPAMRQQIESLLQQGLAVRLIASADQLTHALPLLTPLMDAGMQVKSLQGPDVVLHHQRPTDFSKMHEKVMIFDGRMEDGLVKGGDSLNISENALHHNFENVQFWTGLPVSFFQAHFDWLWTLAKEIDAATLSQARAEAATGGEPTRKS